MSQDESASQSGSSNSSSQLSFFQDNLTDLTLYGSPAPTLVRTGTVVRKPNSVPFRKDRVESTSSNEDDDGAPIRERTAQEKQYRHSLASISERRSSRSSVSNISGKSIRAYSSMETSSDNTDYAVRSTTESNREARTITSPSSTNYLSWIESASSDYFGSAIVNVQDDTPDVDNKVGEWNNFWLNYSNARLRHLSDRTFSSNGVDRTVDETSEDGKSGGSSQRDVTDKNNSAECVMLTLDEVNETIKCSKRITEILLNAMKRNETEEGSNDSYYSQALSGRNSDKGKVAIINVNRERSVSCADPQNIQRQNQELLKTAQQSSSTSCIHAILNTSVADMLKRVIAKRRDVLAPDSERSTMTRNSFSEWTDK
ncbi:uncharacterized protein LOC132698110 [Cylas formicarius]|uniref:uncharacterized protein LOC132698110 n=1 Tax=Cylas formicarius TaxID=197179 RepID=UPI0029587790|nr:uncharacterized protein LOC132698110 [Cylas formicarius]